MAIIQHVYHSNIDASQDLELAQKSEPIIDLKHVSISSLFGRDYVFINASATRLPVDDLTTFGNLLDNLVHRLELPEAYAVVISVEEQIDNTVSFIRHDLLWHKHKICQIESTAVIHNEQYEFMDMIWRSSSPALLN